MKILLLLTVLMSGLIAGLMYAYSCSVNTGLKMLPDQEYVRAMQSINKAILNPLFFSSFLGLIVLFPITGYLVFSSQKETFTMIALAMFVYGIGVFGVTMFFNVPLNNQLADFPLSGSTAPEVSAMRQVFEKPWNTFHTIRTLAAIVSFALALLSLLKYKS